MQKIDVMNTVAKNHGWKSWDDLFWSGEISQAIIDDLLTLYGKDNYETGFRMGVKVVGLNQETNV